MFAAGLFVQPPNVSPTAFRHAHLVGCETGSVGEGSPDSASSPLTGFVAVKPQWGLRPPQCKRIRHRGVGLL